MTCTLPVVDHLARKRKKRWRDECGDCASCTPPGECPDCGTPDCGCGDCSPFLLAPFLLGLIATRKPTGPAKARPGAPGRAGIAAIHGYQRWISPRLRTRCRHRPTCSAYGVIAVERYGLVTGVRLTADRLRRCTSSVPRGTADPVP